MATTPRTGSISASGTGLTASYAYDAQGRRKSKTVNGTTTIYVTDADNREVLEYNGIERRDRRIGTATRLGAERRCSTR